MDSKNRLTRRSIKIKINKRLAVALNEEYSICCAWGFQYEHVGKKTYNIVGWSNGEIEPSRAPIGTNHLRDIRPEMTIRWSETYRVSASETGCMPNFFVDSATDSLPIQPGETFVFDSFDKVSISAKQPPENPPNAFAFTATSPGCSIVLDRGPDLHRDKEEDNVTPVFMASSGAHTFPVPTTGSIQPTDTALIWFQLKSQPLIRRQAFDRKSLTVEPLEYPYGAQSSWFTEITLDFVDGRPQLLNKIITFPTESNMASPITDEKPSSRDFFEQ
ncbi:hypothetical protein COCVIDRAFT_20725 [Bipolaris victoriae FI3]|uniref:Uncharacterized protein n=1 Tax=Bipolaris victoriae (strain FI3) TaxID=930091 RepID=W7EB83_BIPV3|nr:hypothetical protein COCVIDRAFT_20725 [Bipolaris victoriae FI3]